MNRPPARWPEVRRWVGELAELPADGRARRLGEVPTELAPVVRELLAAADGELSGRFDDVVGRRADAWLADLEPGEGAPEAAQSLAGTLLGPWRLERPLGRGGMAEVWEASRADGEYEQVVAVKLIKRGMDSEEIVARFLRERQILARLEHPAIARILDGGLAPDGRPYLVLEKVDGEPLTAWCERTGVGLEQRLQLLIEVCAAVSAAHRQLVVHRDLKPSNILVGADARVKLLDFGIAKLLEEDAEATRTELRLLTPAYAAPEQIRGEPVSTAADVYALGVLAYELLTGKLPHRRRGRDAAELAASLDGEAIVRPSTAVLETGQATVAAHERRHRRRRARVLAGDLDTIVLTALRQEPERRYASAAALAEDVERFLDGRPIAARRDTVGYRARKFIGRHRFGVSAAVLAVLALLALSGVALRQADHAAAQARRAERVQRFLIEVFRKSEPGEALGETLTARQVLEEGVASVERQLAAEPAVAADLYDAMAEIHQRLGLDARAAELAERALGLRDSILAPEPRGLARTLALLASLRLSTGDAAESLALAERGHALVAAAAGRDSLEAGRVESVLAEVLVWHERVEEGLAHQRHVVSVLGRELGGDHTETAAAELRLALVLEAAGDYEASITAFQRALPVLERAHGELHPEVARARRDFAGVLDRMGRTSEAEPLFASALAAQRRVLGDKHPQTAETLFSYGILLNTQARFAAAQAAFAEALEIWGPRVLGGAHCLRYFGISLTEEGRFEEAVPQLEAAVEAYRQVAGEESAETWRALASLGVAHARLGRLAQGEAELREAVARLERIAGPASYQVRLPLRGLGETLRRRGQAEEAVRVLRRTRTLEVELFGTEDHGDIAVTDLQLALALLAIGEPAAAAEAQRLLDEAVTLLRRHGARSGGLGETLVERAVLRAETDPTAARADLDEAAELLAAAYGPDDPRTRQARELAQRTRR